MLSQSLHFVVITINNVLPSLIKSLRNCYYLHFVLLSINNVLPTFVNNIGNVDSFFVAALAGLDGNGGGDGQQAGRSRRR